MLCKINIINNICLKTDNNYHRCYRAILDIIIGFKNYITIP